VGLVLGLSGRPQLWGGVWGFQGTATGSGTGLVELELVLWAMGSAPVVGWGLGLSGYGPGQRDWPG